MAVTLAQVQAELATLQVAFTKLIADVASLSVTPTPAPVPVPTPTPKPTPAPVPTPVPASTESASGTTLTAAAGQIIDATKAVWTLAAGTTGLQVMQNGVAAGYSASVTLLVYVAHVIYQSNGSGWWSWTNSAWTTATDPRVTPTPTPVPTPTPTPTPSTGTGPTATGSFVNVDFTKPTAKKIVRELFGVSTATMLDFNFALCNNTAFQAASKSLNVPLLRFNCNSGSSGGNVWLNLFPNGPAGTPNWSVLTPLVTNLNKIVNLATTKVIMGFGGVTGNDTNGWSTAQFSSAITQVAKYFKTTPGSDGNPINIKYWEIMNEVDIDTTTYNSYFNAAADALHAVDPTYLVMGPAMPNNFGPISALISGSNATRLGALDGHVYLYCPGSDPVPSNAQVAQAQTGGSGTTPEQFAANINSSTAGTFGANIPFFCGEYNIGCGPSDTNGREQTIVGACYAASFVMKLATNANPTIWAGLWEYGTSGGWGTMDSSGGKIDPQAYFLSQACSVVPGTLVSATVSGSNLEAYATVNGGAFAVVLVNYSTTNVNGLVALSHWPVNATGSGSIHRWELSAANLKGAVSTVAVTSGMTASVSVPSQSVVILYP